VDILDEALARIGPDDSSLRARLLAQRGIGVYFRSQDELRANCAEAVAIARRVGNREALTRSLFASLYGAIDLFNVDQRLAMAEELVSLAEETQGGELLLRGLFARGTIKIIRGEMEAANSDIDKFESVAKELRIPRWIWQAELLRAMQALFDGRLVEAEQLAFKAFETGRLADPDNFLQMYSVQLFSVRREQGRLEEMLPATEAFVAQLPAVPAWRAGLAYQYAESGRTDDARREFEILAKDAFGVIPADGNWPIAMALLAEVCCALEDTERAAVLYEKIGPLADLCVVVGLTIDCYGPLAAFAGRLATLLGRWDEAVGHFETSLAINKRMGSRRWTGWTQLRYSDMLVRRDSPGDRQKALALLSQALDVSEQLGLTALLQRSLALKLTAQGIELSELGTSIDTVAREVLEQQPDLKPHAAPDGTVTIMFSDIEGSTEKTDRLGDKTWMEVLREHNTIVRDQIRAFGGYEVKSEGDGFMVAFQSAGTALRCAAAIQKALALRNESAAEQILVRIGLHAGEVIKEGEDFFGRNVIMAARVASQAHGGEILASSVLKALVEGSDISWGEKRAVQLKGLPGDHEIWPEQWAE
jgi:class 3 adenylate cyclase